MAKQVQKAEHGGGRRPDQAQTDQPEGTLGEDAGFARQA
jgi:hypothetical protein